MPDRSLPAEFHAPVPMPEHDYPGGLQGGVPAPPKNPIERPIAAIRRYKWLIIGVVVAFSALGVVGSRFVTPLYQVRATIWVTSENSTENDRVGPIRSAELLSSTAWIELFKSFRIVDEVVRKLALYLEPAEPTDWPLFAGFALADRFLPGDYEVRTNPTSKTWMLQNGQGVVIERGAATDSIGRKAGFRWLLPAAAFQGAGERDIRFHVSTPRETSIRLIDKLTPRLQPGSNFLGLTYEETDPQVAARTLNQWVDEYIIVAADLKKRNVAEFAKILAEQLQYAERATQEAETAYERFRVNTITLPADGVPVAAGTAGQGAVANDPAISSFFQQKIEYDNLRADREALEKNIASASAATAPYEGLLLIPSVATSPGAEALRTALSTKYQLLAKLATDRQTFTDEHPTVKLTIASIAVIQNQTIPQLANQLLNQLRAREMDYERRIASGSRELQQIPPRTIEERRLSRAVQVSEGLYTNLKARYAEAQLAEASATPDIRVLDTAVAPLSPTTNTAPRILLMAIAAGLGVALGLALLLDRLDGRIRYTDQVISELGLPIAGAVPRIPKGGISGSSPEQVVQFVESIRSLRLHVVHSHSRERITLAVTSAAPGDGKSLVSANLALSFGEAGMRTVLVDGDTRRGALHKMFNLSISGGLTDLLAGHLSHADAVRATTHENLSFVSCGRRSSRSPELLTSPKLKEFVAYLSRSFDVVIFDTPPLAAGIDAFAVSAAAGSILMVMRMGQTERRLIAAKLSVLDRLPVEVLGAVLNSTPMTGEFQYYSYVSGYSVENDESGGALIAASNGR